MDVLAGLGTFVRVVDSGSLSGAARALRLSLPAVSRQLRALEDELGAPLLIRSTRRMSLTEAGRQWYETARRLQTDFDDARARIGSPDQVSGVLVVSAPVTLGMAFVVPHLPAIAARHRRLVIELRLEDRLTDFVAEGVDVAIRAGVPPPDSTAYVAQPFARFPRRVYASPSYLRQHGTPREPADLARHACIVQLAPSGPLTRWQLMRAGEEREVSVRGPLHTNAPTAIAELARAGAGIALLPSWLTESDVAARRLRHVLPDWETAPVATWAVYRAELRSSVRLQAFVEALRDLRASDVRSGR